MRIGILGATGAVGMEMLRVLEQRAFPADEIVPLASARSAGKQLEFKGEKITIREAGPGAFDGCDIVLGAAENDVARAMAPHIKKAGAIFVDNSSAFRLEPDVPLVVPEINAADAYAHNGIVANPNCSTIIALMAAAPINAISPITSIVASTYQAVSGAGAAGPVELTEQTKNVLEGKPTVSSVFPCQIAFNLIPQIGSFNDNGYTTEEMKMQNEGRKILHSNMTVSCTCVRVPVIRSHSISLTIRTERPVSVEEAKRAVASFSGCMLEDDPAANLYPTPLKTSGGDIVRVGRIRRDLTDERGLCLWCCGDQLRKGAAQNAVQIAELFI